MSSEDRSQRPHSAVGELPSLLVDPSWLKERLGRPGLRIVDMRDRDAHVSGHIPGAVHLELVDLGSRVAGCDNVLLPPAEFSALMAGRGISTGDAVVAYDEQWGLAAARLVWALHVLRAREGRGVERGLRSLARRGWGSRRG
jgi:thiosulfate/3-mercaptopyruvate sulfurtransferase